MLKGIHFFLTDHYYHTISRRLDEIQDTILRSIPGENGISTEFTSVKDSEIPALPKDLEKDRLLLVTDSSRILNSLLQQKYYTIALYHEGNHSEDFSGTPYAVEDLFSMTFDSYQKAYERLAGLPWQILTTARLSLRESTVADVDDFYRVYRDPSITKYMENLFPDRDEERSYMKDYIEKIYGFYGFGMWTILHTASGQVIGRAGLSVREGYELPELGFVIDVSFQRQGYAFEICRAILQYARDELEFQKVQAFCRMENISSVHLLQKLGFAYAGEDLLNGIPHARYIVTLSETC